MNSKVVVVGSLHYDIVVEAPYRPEKGETVLGYKWFPKFGGKGGNQAMAAAKAGCNVTMVSAVGNDDFARFMLQTLQQQQISTEFIQHRSSVGTGMSVAIMDDEGDYGAVVVSGANLEIDQTPLKNEQLWSDVKMLILQNEILECTNITAASEAKKRHIPVCINAAPAKQLSAELNRLIDILIVNAVEARDMCGIEVTDLDSALSAANKLALTYPQVVVTAGGDGVAFSDRNEQGSIPAKKVKLVSTHGAGDCFVGHLCAALVQGMNLKQAVELGNLKAAEHVSQGKV